MLQALGSQEAETRGTLVSNSTDMELKNNQGRQHFVKDSLVRIKAVLWRVNDLTRSIYPETLAKL
jgi:hypothetical protein